MVGDGPHRRVAASPPNGEVVKVVGALVALVALFLWQCNRPAPVWNAPIRAATSSPTADGPTRASATASGAAVREREAAARPITSVIHQPTAEELAEWKRRNKESMDILRDSTPEIELSPSRR